MAASGLAMIPPVFSNHFKNMGTTAEGGFPTSISMHAIIQDRASQNVADCFTLFSYSFFSSCSTLGVSSLWPSIGNLCPVLSQLQRSWDGRDWWGWFNLCLWLVSFQSFPTVDFQFLGYELAGVLSCLSHDPGSFSLCLSVNQYFKGRTVDQKLLCLRVEALGPCPPFLLTTDPLLGLNEFELMSTGFFSPCVSKPCVGRKFRQNILLLILQRFSFGFLLFRWIVLKL